MLEDFRTLQPDEYTASYDALNETDQEALDYFTQGGSRKTPGVISGVERRSMPSQLEWAITTFTEMKYISSGTSEKDVALREFQDWVPKSLQETNTVLDGVMKRVRNAANTRTGSPEAAVKDRYNTCSGYLLDAAEDMQALHQGLSNSEGEGSRPDPGLIRSSHRTLDVIAEQMMHRAFLWDNHWPSHNTNAYKERLKYWRGFTLAAAKYADDEHMVQLYEFAKERNDKRFKYWLKEKNLVENMPEVQKLIAHGVIMPITLNGLLHRKAREFEDQQEDTFTPDAGQNEPTDYNTLLSDRAREEIEAKQREEEARVAAANEIYDQEYDRLDAQGLYTPETIRAQLARMGIGRAALSTETREEQERKELEEIAARANKPKKLVKKKKRVIGKWRESGPSDKRKERDYR